MKRVLFVCTGNTCRSPMAEALFRHLKGTNEWQEASAGIFAATGSPASPYAVEVLREKGIDLSRHRSQLLTSDLLDQSDLIITMTKGQEENLLQHFPEIEDKVYLINAFGTSKVPADVMDPFGGSIEMYKKTCDEIERAVGDLVLFIHNIKTAKK